MNVAAHSLAGRKRCSKAFTLVELLVVIAIIGVLVALLLPAIQAAREASRRAQCGNRLRQMGLAALNHEAAQKTLPVGGWGWGWAGDPDKGYGINQPGGWYYNSLEFLEQGPVRRIGSDGNPNAISAQQKTEGARRIAISMNEFMCPSRPGMPTKPYTGSTGFVNITVPAGGMVGRNDYAANGGDRPPSDNATDTWRTGGGAFTQYGPTDPNTVNANPAVFTRHFELLFDLPTGRSSIQVGANGVVGPMSVIKLTQVEDGASMTIWVGEKYIPQSQYDAGAGVENQGNDQGWDCGYDHDNVRWTMDAPKPDEWIDPNGGLTSWRSIQVFGSAHPAGCLFVYLDGSVHMISYDVDPAAYHVLGNRFDGEVVANVSP
jgi:prepilin-type N-terminal cleavage/methylation domain-containing protein